MLRPLLIVSISVILTNTAMSQSDNYFSGGMEMIFSWADITDHGDSENSLMRWAPFFNIQAFYNANMSEKFGIFSGLAIRNVGYIYENYQPPGGEVTYKKKFRSYNLGIPAGIKLGNLDKMYFYGGYEIEFPFHYKEKTFDDGDKIDKITGWFSNRTENLQHGFFAGVQLPFGTNIKFKYYLSEFHNQSFQEGTGVRPYEGLESNVWYISLCFLPFVAWKDLDDYDWD